MKILAIDQMKDRLVFVLANGKEIEHMGTTFDLSIPNLVDRCQVKSNRVIIDSGYNTKYILDICREEGYIRAKGHLNDTKMINDIFYYQGKTTRDNNPWADCIQMIRQFEAHLKSFN